MKQDLSPYGMFPIGEEFAYFGVALVHTRWLRHLQPHDLSFPRSNPDSHAGLVNVREYELANLQLDCRSIKGGVLVRA